MCFSNQTVGDKFREARMCGIWDREPSSLFFLGCDRNPMTASRPNNEAIFHAARDIPDPDRRRAYVREACGGDEARVVHVEALLAAADAPDSLLDRPAGSGPVGSIDQHAPERLGTMIGPYKLVEVIGEGGMG